MTNLLGCEVWQSIPGYEGYYDVSSFGSVRSWYVGGGYRLNVPAIKKIQSDKDGYPFVLLYKVGSVKGFRVSRLVLLAFVGHPNDGMEASHLDGDKTNNHISNLVWESRYDNEQRKVSHGTRPRGEGSYASKVTEAQVMEMRTRRATGTKLHELAGVYGLSVSNVATICNRRSWKHVE